MRRALPVAALVAFLLAAPTHAAAAPRTPCEAADDLRENQPEIALALLKKAVATPANRDCAVDLLNRIVEEAGEAAKKAGPPYTRCKVAEELLDKKLVSESRAQYEKAIDADPPLACGVAGLVDVKEKEDASENDDKHLSPAEAGDDLWDFVLGNWPWPAALIVLWGLGFVFGNRITVRASEDDKNVAGRIVASANAAGGEAPGPVKVAVSADSLPDGSEAEISSLLRLPGTAPLAALLKILALFPSSQRLYVESAAAGGWAVLSLTLRMPGAVRKRTAHFALALGDADDKTRDDVLGLVGGAWLVATLQDPDTPSPVAPDEPVAACAHALFRAGSNCQSRGLLDPARACYAAMPAEHRLRDAPFAWAGARLNQMIALQQDRRWDEAARMADVVTQKFPDELPDDIPAQSIFGAAELADLVRRKHYMVAVVRTNHHYAAAKDESNLGLNQPQLAALEAAAGAAVEELDVDVESAETDDARSLAVASAMVKLCFEIATGETRTIAQVHAALLLREHEPRGAKPLLGGGPYFDAACAASMLYERADVPDPPEGLDSAEALAEEGVRLIGLSYRATPPARRERTRKLAQTEPMLEHLRKKREKEFAEEIEAKPAPPAEEEQRPVGQILAELMRRL